MKKFNYVFLLILTLGITSMLLSEVPVSANSKSAYKKYRKSHNIISHKLVDIDKNGIKEMLFLTKNYKYGVCTYKNNKVFKVTSMTVGKSNAYVYINKKRHQFALIYSDTGTVRYKVYKLKGKKAKVVKTLKSQRQYPGFDRKYYINGKETTYEEFINEVRAIWKWKTVNLLSN